MTTDNVPQQRTAPGAEIGVVFSTYGEMTPEQRKWWTRSRCRELIGEDLLKGYATLCYPERNTGVYDEPGSTP